MTERDTVDGYVEAFLEAHSEGLHDDAPQRSCPVCQEEERADGGTFDRGSIAAPSIDVNTTEEYEPDLAEIVNFVNRPAATA